MQKLIATLAILTLSLLLAVSLLLAAQPTLPDNRTISPVWNDSPFFPPDPVPDDPTRDGAGCDINGFCYPPASPVPPDCAYTGSCN